LLQDVIDLRYPASPEDLFEKDVLLKATLWRHFVKFIILKNIFFYLNTYVSFVNKNCFQLKKNVKKLVHFEASTVT